jgi:hypothetical protein
MSGQKPTNDTLVQERQDLRRRMTIQRQVELAMNGLIQGMVKLVDETKIPESRMEKHQIKNLLGVALETRSVEVVKHYILYQAGRDTPGTSWRQNNFGDELVKKLDALRSDAKRIIRQTDKLKDSDEPDSGQVDWAWLLLVQAYLGQFNRYFYYRKEGGKPWPPATS